MATIVCAAIALGADAFAYPKPKESIYHKTVSEIRAKQEAFPLMPIFVAGAVKKPGAYQFKGPATVADLVNVAGGFSFAVTTAPVSGWITVYHPTREDPDPWGSAVQCSLNVKKLPDMGFEYCTNRVATNDLVFVTLMKDFQYVLP